MCRKLIRWLLVGLVGSSVAFSQVASEYRGEEKAPVSAGPPEPPKILPDPNDAVRYAYADLLTIPRHIRPFIRYIYHQNLDDRRGQKTTSLAWNYVSRASKILLPAPVANGLLLRIDLRLYAPQLDDLVEFLAFWEDFGFDPHFSLLITKDTIRFARLDTRDLPRKKVRRIISKRIPSSSKFRKPRIVSQVIEEEVNVVLNAGDVVRLNNKGIDPLTFLRLQAETRSIAPVVEHRYFKYRILHTIKNIKENNKLYDTIFGGRYYEFAGIRKAQDVLGKDTKATDLDLFFESIGIGNIKGGVNYEQLFDRLRSDYGIIILRSKVTGKPRDVWWFQPPSSRDGSGGAITGDVDDSNIDLGFRSFANLLNPRRDAREAIFPKGNQLLLFVLFNGAGARQDEVPPDIANDTTIPDPHTKRLDIFGCVTCHSIKGKDGWQPLVNEVGDLKRLDIFDDAGDKKKIRTDIIDRLTGRYTGDFSDNIRAARNHLARATLRATGPWKESEDQADVCRLAAQHLHSETGGYWWDLVDARVALRELGVEVAEEQAVGILNKVLPPDTRLIIRGREIGDRIIPEDPRIGLLKEGKAINRSDWALAYAFAAERARRNPIFVKYRTQKKK